MYSVYLVDDQEIIVHSLEKIIDWSSFGFQVEGMFYNGLEAYEAIINKEPDLLLVDIKMPKMNGLELIKRIKEENHNIKIIILSAYGEFDYAREAIKLGVFGYLLKPLDEDELEKQLVQIKEKLDEDNLSIKNSQMFELMEDYISNIHSKIFKRMVDEKTTTKELKNIFGKLGLNFKKSNYIFMVAHIIENKSKDERAATELNLIHELNETLHLFDEACSFYLNTNKILCMIKDEKNRMHPISKRMLVKKIDEQLKRLSLKGSFTIVSVNADEQNIKEVLKKIYRLSHLYFYNQKRIILLEQNELTLEIKNFEIKNQQVIIEKILLASSYEELNELSKVFERIRNENNYDTEQIYNVFDNLLDQVEKELASRHLTFINRGSIRHNLTLCDMENYIKYVIELYIETLKQKDDSTYIVDLAKQYAKEHLKEEISLEKIEGELNISRNYFCCLFKETTGETFWDYITRIRVEKAKELLSTGMKNYEITLEVGYENPSYLSKVFKKYVGLTPTQYRKKVNKLH